MPSQALPCPTLLCETGAPPGLLEHSRLVAAAATRLAALCRADQDYCAAAAWVHDLGKAGLAVQRAACLTGRPADELRELDHAALGALLLRSLGPEFAQLAPSVARHLIGGLLGVPSGGPGPPVTLEDKVVFAADKLVGSRWLGLKGRSDDLLKRHGHLYDIHLCLPGVQAIFLELAALACLSPGDLERQVGAAVALAQNPQRLLPHTTGAT